MFLGAYFTPGRIVFILFFVLCFSIGMIWSYRKDLQNHKTYYKKSGKKVLFFGFVIMAIFMGAHYLIKNL